MIVRETTNQSYKPKLMITFNAFYAVPNQPPYSGYPSPPPTSTVNIYELSFGTVCGVCAGVFIKKGAKAIAFILGGIFMMLQVRDFSPPAVIC